MNKKYYIIPIFVPHKGCPHDCVFCNQKKITGSEIEIDENFVYSQVDDYLKTIDRNNSHIELSFYGGSFTGIPVDYQNELLKAANNILLEGKIDDIRISTRPDYINRFILENLSKYNVGIIELGVQSLDEEVLKASERGHTTEDVFNAVRLIKSFGLKLGLQMMIGLPKDNLIKDIDTAQKIIELKPDFVRIYPALIIKDTYMEWMYYNGIYTPLSLDEAIFVSKKVYLMFLKSDIPVIRIGLQASEGINLGKDVIAGPFHPSFRELVESSILSDMIEFVVNEYFNEENLLRIRISNNYISKLYAGKKKYYNDLKERLKNIKLNIETDYSLEGEYLLFESDKLSRKMSIKDYAKISI
ncbi:Oxygen-independent coproporphyrinogen-III oxidase 2 [Caloramator mitchellensis]|uniref:Oxygen-independent coproporphyrinogen-III oxidase 2 n=1 Tax=Caloramator mitchellensis TaxID=908809 RepID=A0A0R3JTZ3_CALMK|nr:radical SAM protein [Caloramator mitchellensis]KRQ86952.1 Oxygen-independent coproporphyrinogen-III oxidase 2 [Caloramator mitchellensis]